PFRDSESFHERLSTLSHTLRNARKVALFPQCLVWIHRSTFVLLYVPFCHLQDARHVNFAAAGAPFSPSRASSSAWTLTPLLTLVIAMVEPLVAPLRRLERPGASPPS